MGIWIDDKEAKFYQFLNKLYDNADPYLALQNSILRVFFAPKLKLRYLNIPALVEFDKSTLLRLAWFKSIKNLAIRKIPNFEKWLP